MIKCPYCHQLIPATATICPNCQADLTIAFSKEVEEQEALFTPINSTNQAFNDSDEETVVPEIEAFDEQETLEEIDAETEPVFDSDPLDLEGEQENQPDEQPPKRFIKESRHYQTNQGLQTIWSKVGDYFLYLKNYLLEPSFKRRTRRTENTYHGYITLILTILFSASAFTRLITGLINQYNFFADISILPAFEADPDPIWLWVKSIAFFAIFYIGLIILSYWLKRIFLKRKHAFHYWVTQYEGTNTIALLIALLAFVLALIAPVFLSSLIIFLLLMTLMTYFTTFVGSIYKTMNETSLDHLYVVLIGWFIHLFLTMASFYILYL